MANITIANNTKRPICSNGAIAFIMDFKTTCKPVNEIVNFFQEKRIKIKNNILVKFLEIIFN